MNANNATCETILNDLQLLNPAVELDISDVYSARRRHAGSVWMVAPIQVLLAELDEHQCVSKYICDDDGLNTHLFLAHPRAVQLTRAYHSVLLMDGTYKTNRFRMPLLNMPVAYVETVWIRPHNERFVAAWTDQHLHLGNAATSRVEGAHSRLKRYVKKSNSDLLTVFDSMHRAFEQQHRQLQSKQCNQQIRRVMDLNHPIYSNVQLKISRYALFQSNLQYRKVLAASSLQDPSPLADCTGAFTRTMGIPCAHATAEIPDGQKLQMSDFRQHWWLARQQPALIREPRVANRQSFRC
ncbi:hypothetical protein PsorP6_001571 [Peronosclerospora sorghi]|uniref:Uncharacterized protein n=1 Tax=Peronosclerospora sorghi TaxID=230839 RepID=A0ACC0WTJ3_9STRA|nr:hypothetical protein PsorP6_001571 [Peronosclerospora sorghi]